MWELKNDLVACEIDLCVLMQECELAVEDGQFVLEAIHDGKNTCINKGTCRISFSVIKETRAKD